MSVYGAGVYGAGLYGVGSGGPVGPVEPQYKEPGRPTDVIVGGHNLNSFDPVLDVAWRFRTITGWHKGLGVRRPEIARENAHGSYPQRGYRTGRLITIRGDIVGRGPAPVGRSLELLSAMLADGRFATFRFDDTKGDNKTSTVQLHAIDDGGWNNSPTCSYQLQLWAPDPYRYGATSEGSTPFPAPVAGRGLRYPLFTPDGFLSYGGPLPATGTVEISNPGTAEAYPVYEITGPTPASGFEIVDTTGGGRFKFMSVVPTGATLRVDTADGSAVINGTADRGGDLIVTRWPTIPRESSSIVAFQPLAETTTAVMTASVAASSW